MIERVLRRGILPICLLITLLGLSACGDLPEPFLGNPGATAQRLAKPPAPLLAVTPGTDTLLPDQANKDLAEMLAKALQATEVPAMVRNTPEKTDWRLITRATQSNNMVSPEFSVINPSGKEEGKAVGEPVPVAEWASASPELLHRIAAEAAPRVGAVLTGIRIAHEKADPNSLYNRPAKVMVADVTGAPGDGDVSLTRQMRARLAVLGPVVLTTPTDADFIVHGKVVVTPLPQHKERVEIQWSVTSPSGDDRGKVVQLNEIPAGTLDHYWGDVAVVVAAEASNGINDVIRRQSDREPASAQPSKASAPATTGPETKPESMKSAAPHASVVKSTGTARAKVHHAVWTRHAKANAPKGKPVKHAIARRRISVSGTAKQPVPDKTDSNRHLNKQASVR